MKKQTMLFFAILFSISAYAQSPFTRIFQQDTSGFTDMLFGFCSLIQNTSDGGHLLHFYTGFPDVESQYYSNLTVIKTDSAFRPHWKRHSGSEWLVLPGGAMITSLSEGYLDTSGCSLIQKRDLAGNVIWSKLLSKNVDTSIAVGNPVRVNTKIRFTGAYKLPFTPVFADIDSMGNLLTAMQLNDNNVAFEHVYADDSGNCYFVLANMFGTITRSLAKLRPDNSIAWTLDMPSNFFDIASLVTLPNGDIICGGNYRKDDSARIFLMKLSASGAVIWQKAATRSCRLSDMQLAPGGNIYIAAGGMPIRAFSYIYEDDLIKIDSGGNVQWARNFAPDRTSWPFYKGISTPLVGSGGSLSFATVTAHPYAFTAFSTDSNGVGLCNSAVVPMSFHDTVLFSMVPRTLTLSPVALTMSNYTYSYPELHQEFADGCGYVPSAVVLPAQKQHDLSLFPNPAITEFRVSGATDIRQVALFVVTGKLVSLTEGAGCMADICVRHLRPGYYIARITAGGNTSLYRKLIIIN